MCIRDRNNKTLTRLARPAAVAMIAASLLTVVAVAMAKETRHRDLADVAPSGGTRGKADASPAARDAHTV